MMHNQPDALFDDQALDTFEFEPNGPLRLAEELERTHAVARGIEAAIRLVRANSVRCEIGHSPTIESDDVDALLALAGQAAGMLAERGEDLAGRTSVVAPSRITTTSAQALAESKCCDG
ncbi:hypothetical protein AB4Y44_19015 [Paraburkholderia sp. BR10937]|uniref:hypothetical protein n=1 Tax=Paraburkholderia sp. BR10937 TaxID=3236994 RepID=UPI0034D1D5F0